MTVLALATFSFLFVAFRKRNVLPRRLERMEMPKEMASKLGHIAFGEEFEMEARDGHHSQHQPVVSKSAAQDENVNSRQPQHVGDVSKSPDKNDDESRHRPPVQNLVGEDGLARPSWPKRDGKQLDEPLECRQWRLAARDLRSIRLYRKHFVSHDMTDWFVYAAFFTEAWHARGMSERPVYLDVAANHARRWSGTYFLDRCMGWDGVCVEANEKYWGELRAQRHCQVVNKCVSDIERTVNFSLTDAFGGVVSNIGYGGVNGSRHKREEKFKGQFHGIKSMKCSTLGKEMKRNHIHFWSLDVEGHEAEVLQGFDWNKTSVDVIVTENRGKGVQAILSGRGFERVSGVLKDDIWIRNGSGFKVSEQMRWLMSRFDRNNYRFSGI
ncbi:hypothetical protein BWQ96_06007 [Gracilariopsis chorda]|uniref:Methyltransferase FkbM domain-containing protein n=1 Tax=Gracilariopsis chorda TaxID=448386 RepID=A0A2V3IQ61_9FLOR|nr:hypothetical protein BWQ96_06007 [Gracilariopsis chorda]|eukprot:PXF44226.1 hypothetical protein BWQ96_06007 [Gracilariopsis chorda]